MKRPTSPSPTDQLIESLFELQKLASDAQEERLRAIDLRKAYELLREHRPLSKCTKACLDEVLAMEYKARSLSELLVDRVKSLLLSANERVQAAELVAAQATAALAANGVKLAGSGGSVETADAASRAAVAKTTEAASVASVGKPADVASVASVVKPADGAISDGSASAALQAVGEKSLPIYQAKRGCQRKPHVGVAWLEEHSSEFPQDEWLAVDGFELVASDPTMPGLIQKLEQRRVPFAEVCILYNESLGAGVARAVD